MGTSIKLKNNTYWDSKGITHNNKLLSDILYPVGSVYMSVNSTSPATLFGGTWTQISGRFLYCTTTSKTTGGSTTTGSASGNTGATTLTTSQIPAHSHSGTTDTGKASGMIRVVHSAGGTVAHNHVTGYSSAGYTDAGHGSTNWNGSSHYHDFTTGNTGGGGSHTHTLNSHTHSQNLPPYFTVYCWYRTA